MKKAAPRAAVRLLKTAGGCDLCHLPEHLQFALHGFHFSFQIAQVLFESFNVIIAGQGDHIAVLGAAAAVTAASTGILMSGHGDSPSGKIGTVNLADKVITLIL
jgi:hypothetical protein